jgi:RimJ/RimL family protein N-acetyltransferase
MRAVLEWACGNRVGAPHVVALTDEPNIASWKLMEKLGMERREDLDFIEDGADRIIQYSLTKTQWEQSQ